MGNDQEVPEIIQDVSHIALYMAVAVVLGRQQITGPRIMALLQKRIAHDTEKLAGDKDTQALCG